MKQQQEEIFDLIASSLDVKRSDIRLGSTWKDYSADSLDLVELIFALEEHFDITFAPAELGAIKTVRDLVNAVAAKLAAASGNGRKQEENR
jgi:acyl carrier protein